FENKTAVKVQAIPEEDFETGDPEALLEGVDAVLVPGGFGNRGIEGKISAVRVAREAKIPFLGLCLGMQCAVIEFARHVAGLKGAHSTEFDTETPFPVFDYLPGQDNNTRLGGTLRLGAHPCTVKEGTLARKIYGVDTIVERHRHRFEFNRDFQARLEKAGMLFSGINETTGLVEMIELPVHPWFVAVLFHPEFKSRPHRAHPLFREFIAAALRMQKN
ncbi:MAG: gamma-glutamyl-gamma-aminobutyrate hydrolase family protein, partial [Dethiobacteria bacterium]